MPKNKFKTQQTPQQPNQGDQPITLDEAKDLLEQGFNDHGITKVLDLKDIEEHMKKVDDHDKDIDDLKKRVDALEKGQTPQTQATQQAQAQQSSQQGQQQIPVQQGQQQVSQQANQPSFWIQSMYCEPGGRVASATIEDAIQAGATNPTLNRCMVNSLNQVAPLTKEQMVVAGFVSLTCRP